MKLSRLQTLRRSRSAWWLAVLAAVLQLAMGLQSAQHQVRMAGQSDLLAVVNAVVDALRPMGVTDIAMPCTPERVWRAIQGAGSGGSTTEAAMPHFDEQEGAGA